MPHAVTKPTHATADQSLIVLLIDDQPIVGAAVAQMLKGENIEFHHCADPNAAIETAKQVRPTVILQDLVMPDIDGMTLVRSFRANAGTAEVPLVVLSTKEDPAIKAQAFASGANDYMVKFPDRLEVLARIRYHSKGYLALLQRNTAYAALADELNQAASYVRSLLPAPRATSPKTDWRFEPSSQLGGDCLGYHWLDDDHFAVYLLDVCGHGVGAALLGVSIINVLSTQALSETDPHDPAAVLAKLNQTFPAEQHGGKFFSMWYGVFNRKNRELTYANGGHPPGILLLGDNQTDARVEKLESTGLLVGAMEGVPYDNRTVSCDSFCKLFLFSDGAFEIQMEDGEMWPFNDFVDLIAGIGRDVDGDLGHVWQHVTSLSGSEQLEDDFSLLQVEF